MGVLVRTSVKRVQFLLFSKAGIGFYIQCTINLTTLSFFYVFDGFLENIFILT